MPAKITPLDDAFGVDGAVFVSSKRLPP